MSGVYAVAVAALLCTRQVSLYGFSDYSYSKQVRGATVPYHYYDSCKPAKNDHIMRTAKSIKLFNTHFSHHVRIKQIGAERKLDPPFKIGSLAMQNHSVSHDCMNESSVASYVGALLSVKRERELSDKQSGPMMP